MRNKTFERLRFDCTYRTVYLSLQPKFRRFPSPPQKKPTRISRPPPFRPGPLSVSIHPPLPGVSHKHARTLRGLVGLALVAKPNLLKLLHVSVLHSSHLLSPVLPYVPHFVQPSASQARSGWVPFLAVVSFSLNGNKVGLREVLRPVISGVRLDSGW